MCSLSVLVGRIISVRIDTALRGAVLCSFASSRTRKGIGVDEPIESSDRSIFVDGKKALTEDLITVKGFIRNGGGSMATKDSTKIIGLGPF